MSYTTPSPTDLGLNSSLAGMSTLGLSPVASPTNPAPSPFEMTPNSRNGSLVTAAPQIDAAAKDSNFTASTDPFNAPLGVNLDGYAIPADQVSITSQAVGPQYATGSYNPGNSPQIASGASWTPSSYNLLSSFVGRGLPDDDHYTYTGSNMKLMIQPAVRPATAGAPTPNKQLVECTTLTISIHREKSPVRACGYINPKGFARGRRTIAGTMILTPFTVDVLYRFLGGYTGTDMSKDSGYVKVDQLPPFDATLYFADEYGHISSRRLLGIDFLTDGVVYSVHDQITEQTVTYMAADFTPLLPSSATPSRSAYYPGSASDNQASPTVWSARQTPAATTPNGAPVVATSILATTDTIDL